MSTLRTIGGAGFILAVIWMFLKLLRLNSRRFPVRDKLVLITGASSGLGEACAHTFHAAGAKVVLCARRKDQLERVKSSLVSSKVNNPHDPVVVSLDLSDLKAIPEIISDVINKHGAIDILINNGGISYRGEIANTGLDVDRNVMLVNYFGQVALTKAVLPAMLQRRSGHIVTVSSVQGKMSIPFRSAYSASKHALQAFCDGLRAEVAEHEVKVSLFSPSYISTNLSLNAVTQDGRQYGVMDSNTETGMSPEYAAAQVLKCVEMRVDELISGPIHHKAAIFLRTLYPPLFFWIMRKRAKKQRLEMRKDK